MARRIILIKHEDSPGDDRAAAWFAKQGFALDWRAPYTGDPLPTFDDSVAGALLYGGPQSAADADRFRYLEDEARWVRQCIANDVPILGLCLGGQVVAHALGASVGPDRQGNHEFGYYELAPTDRGRAYFPDPLVVPQDQRLRRRCRAGLDLQQAGDPAALSRPSPCPPVRVG